MCEGGGKGLHTFIDWVGGVKNKSHKDEAIIGEDEIGKKVGV